MNQRHDETGRNEQTRSSERTNWRTDPSQREFYPGNHGFQESAQPDYGPGQPGQGAGSYGASGASQYTAGIHPQSQYTIPQGQYHPPGQYEGGYDPRRGDPRERSGQYGADYSGAGHQYGQPPYAGAQGRYTPPGQYERGGFERGGFEQGGSNPLHRGAPPDTPRDRDRGFSSFAQHSFGHSPFGHSAFGESNEPHYFGTGAQGYGGGPSFTGGTYGYADQRSDAPRFEEVGFNRGRYEDGPRGVSGHDYSTRSMPGPSQERRRYRTGPKGYQRSDERLREDISERLMQSYHIDSSEVTVQVQGGKVILEGSVPDRYMKHEIEDLAANAPGVQDVENRIRVGHALSAQSPNTLTSDGTLVLSGSSTGSNTGSAAGGNTGGSAGGNVAGNPATSTGTASIGKDRVTSRSATSAERSETSGRDGPGR